MPTRIDIAGIDEIEKILDDLQDDRIRDDALWAGAEVVRKTAQRAAPQDTGALKASIYSKTTGRSGYQMAAARAKALSGVKDVQPEETVYSKDKALVGVAAPYGRLIEYVHRAYLRPALDRNKKAVAEAMLAAVRDQVPELE